MNVVGGIAPLADELPRRRVREELRDGLAVVAFSAVASTGLALLVSVLSRLAS